MEAAREYKRKRYDVLACYEHYAEKGQKVRKELTKLCGIKAGVTRKTKQRSPEELAEVYARHRELAEGRANSTIPAATARQGKGQGAGVKGKRPVSPKTRGKEETTPNSLRLPPPTPGFFNVAGKLPSPEALTLVHEETQEPEDETATVEEEVDFDAIAEWFGVE
jgi:hypothetical protein